MLNSRPSEPREPARLVVRFCWGITAVVVGALVALTVLHDFQVLLASKPGEPYPMPLYGLMPATGTSPIHGSPGAAGADFSQVYTSAQALRHGESAYHPANRRFQDRYARVPGYPPLTNRLYVPLTRLPYHLALLAHTCLSLLVYLGAAGLVLWQAGLARHVWRVVLSTTSLYFLTPIGLTLIERGQFDLFVATSFVACLACALVGRARLRWAVASGMLAALKWTAGPFLGCFAALGFLSTRNARRWVWVMIPGLMGLLTVAFWRDFLEYWAIIRHYEVENTPNGLSLQHFLPRLWARSVPVLLTLVVVAVMLVWIRSPRERHRIFTSVTLPFALALVNVALCFGTLSFEYHTLSLLGMIPALVVWIEREPWVSYRAKAFTSTTFGLFLVVAFRVFGPSQETFGPVAMTYTYCCFALLFLGQCLYLVVRLERVSAPWPAPGSPEPG